MTAVKKSSAGTKAARPRSRRSSTKAASGGQDGHRHQVTTAKKAPRRPRRPPPPRPHRQGSDQARPPPPSRPPAKKAHRPRSDQATGQEGHRPRRRRKAPAGKPRPPPRRSHRPRRPRRPRPKRSRRPAPPSPRSARPSVPTPRTQKFLDAQRALLLEERAVYAGQAVDLRAEADSLALEREPGDVQFDEESGEGGTVTVDRERNLALSAQATAAVEEIDDALRKIDRKYYGGCERCFRPIPKARLQALPFARLCVACKSGGLSRR